MTNTHQPESVGLSTKRLNRIDTVLQRYIDDDKFAGLSALVARRGKVVYRRNFGAKDKTSGAPITDDTIFRIYSMTKPITATALMMLYEQGLFHLHDPIYAYMPEWTDVKVYDDGKLVDPIRPVTVQDLLRHTSGLTYGLFGDSPVDKLYAEADLFREGMTNAQFSKDLARLPLAFQPGTQWCYSVSTDIIGALVEVLSGQTLADFMAEHIFEPLGMVDTSFEIAPAKLERLATLYTVTPDEPLALLDEPKTTRYLAPVTFYSGGGGLISTRDDYSRFAHMRLKYAGSPSGELDGTRLLGRATVELMTRNHLPPEVLPINFGGPMPGVGYGLGMGVMLEPAEAGMMGSAGDSFWGGYAETYHWVDPREELVCILMGQTIPSMQYPIRKDMRTLVYQAVVD